VLQPADNAECSYSRGNDGKKQSPMHTGLCHLLHIIVV
jgi:hypothetical protein